jgi:TRAP-type mannitol/chloroaromatic compound transport system substrate-binding protein
MKNIALRLAAVMLVLAFAGFETVAIAQTVDGPKVNWRLGAWGKSRAVTKGFETVKKYVEEKTGGKFSITIGFESFGGPKELLDLVKVHSLQMSMYCASYHPDKTPANTALDLPFLPLASPKTELKVHETFYQHPYIKKELAEWNAFAYMPTILPQYEFVGRGKPPTTIEGFKGLRVRALGGMGDAMKKLGAIPTSVPATEVYTALERGTVDAVSFPATYAHASFRTYEIGDWYTANLAPGTVGCPTLMALDAYEKLPPQYKKLLDEAKPLGYKALMTAYKEADDVNIPLFKKSGLKFITYSDKELERFRKIGAEPVWEQWVKTNTAKGVPAQELLDLILDTAKAAKAANG